MSPFVRLADFSAEKEEGWKMVSWKNMDFSCIGHFFGFGATIVFGAISYHHSNRKIQ